MKKAVIFCLVFLLCVSVVSAEKFLWLESGETKTISFFDEIHKVNLVRVGKDAVRFKINDVIDDVIAIEEFKKYLVGNHKVAVELVDIVRGEAVFKFEGIYIHEPIKPIKMNYNELPETEFFSMELEELVSVHGGKEFITIEFLETDKIARYAEFRVGDRYYRTYINDLNYVVKNGHEFIFRLVEIKRTNAGYSATIEAWSDHFVVSLG